MKRYIRSNTRANIESIQDKINLIKERLQDPYMEDDERYILQDDLAYWQDQLRFAWADDEDAWTYARDAQEFNPDGSLALYSSTSIECSDDVEYDGKIHEGLVWDRNGHEYTVAELTVPGKSCLVTERWISEDSGRELEKTSKWSIVEDPSMFIDREDSPVEFMYPAEQVPNDYNSFYATSARNFETTINEDSVSWDYESGDDKYYTPSATRGDYSPSSPWNAPGMSMSDFF